MEESAMTKEIIVDETSSLIKNCWDLYEAVVRNGFYLPKIKTTIISEDYMSNVILGKVFYPQ